MSHHYLPSWNLTKNTQAILDFVKSATTPGEDYIDPAERIAVFDNDGTMWCEQPMPTQFVFLLQTWLQEVHDHPELKDKQPYKAVLQKDEKYFTQILKQTPKDVMQLEQALTVWAGSTPQEFAAQVQKFFTTTKHPKYNMHYTDLVYQPMLELFDLLKAHNFRVFVCSAGGRDFMRVVAEDMWGIHQENVIGTAAEYEYVNGQIVRTDHLLGGFALGAGKTTHIFAATGRLPLLACGNGDPDIEMLQSARFGMLIHHDDEVREYAYDTGAEQVHSLAQKNNYIVVSMKHDWVKIFKNTA